MDLIIVVLIFLMGVTLTKLETLDEIDRESLDINELFSSITKPSDKVLKGPPNAVMKNISVDIERLDVQKFRRKMEMFKAQFGGFDKIGNNTILFNETKRSPALRASWEDYRASRHVIVTKMLDLMLQMIYMARHKIRQLESERYFNRHDTSYRIAFLYRRLRKIWKKMMDIITTLRKNIRARSGPWYYAKPYLILHHKAAAMHVDFLYLFWALVNLNYKHSLGHYIPNTTPVYND